MAGLVCIDVDGTLVGSSGTVHPDVWAAAARARDEGIHLAICSGRPAFGTTADYAAHLDPTGWHVFQNGASVVNLATSESHSKHLSEAAVEPLGYLDPLLTITGFRVTPVVARIDPGFRPRPDPREVAEVFEVPFVDLLRPVNLERRELRVAGRPRSVYEYIGPGAGGRRIWGATASILHNFALRLEHARLEQA